MHCWCQPIKCDSLLWQSIVWRWSKNYFARCKVSSHRRRSRCRRQKLARVTNKYMQSRAAAQTSDNNLYSPRARLSPFHRPTSRSWPPVQPTSEANVFTVKSRCLDRQMKPRYICVRLQMLLLIRIEEEKPFRHRHGLKTKTRGENIVEICAQDQSFSFILWRILLLKKVSKFSKFHIYEKRMHDIIFASKFTKDISS